MRETVFPNVTALFDDDFIGWSHNANNEPGREGPPIVTFHAFQFRLVRTNLPLKQVLASVSGSVDFGHGPVMLKMVHRGEFVDISPSLLSDEDPDPNLKREGIDFVWMGAWLDPDNHHLPEAAFRARRQRFSVELSVAGRAERIEFDATAHDLLVARAHRRGKP